jgi:DNA-binding NarL/FixJ family response regulator
VERTIRILIADDHAVVREGLRAVLGSEPDMEVVGEAATGKEVLERAAELRPDVILMDIQMPGINGIEATRRILDASPKVGVVVLTMFEDDESVFSAMRAGARGYVLKGAHPSEILKVLRAVAGGEAYFGPEIARRLVDFFSTPKPPSPAEAFPELTAREREILRPHRPRPQQRRDRRTPLCQPQDRRQPYLAHIHQTAGGRPGSSDHPSPRSGVGREDN